MLKNALQFGNVLKCRVKFQNVHLEIITIILNNLQRVHTQCFNFILKLSKVSRFVLWWYLE